MESFIQRAALAPFHLAEKDLDWIREVASRLPRRRRLAQLFNVMLNPMNEAVVDAIRRECPGAITQFMIGGADLALSTAQGLAAALDLPLLVSADVEGGPMSLSGTTPMPCQLGMAAMADPLFYRECLQHMAMEAARCGINWTFTPVVDVNAEFRSAIVGTRSFGSLQGTVQSLGEVHIQAMQDAGLAATAKHWPGEGFDCRDQHLVTTVNPLSVELWRDVFGAIYARQIAAGVKTIMTGHIAFPAYAKSKGVEGVEAYRPASISRLINQQLLRDELGFNGLITSDASAMAGLTCWAHRDTYLPEILASGCDMVLFTPDLSRDLDLLEQALDDGRLSAARVDEALVRVLALKAALGLHEREALRAAPPLQSTAAQAAAAKAAAKSITLVKDVHKVLPLDPARGKRVTLILDGKGRSLGPFKGPEIIIDTLLAERGFEVRVHDRAGPLELEQCDLLIYVLAQESLATTGQIFVDWASLHGPDFGQSMRRSWHERPTILLSLGHPYYLFDAPRMPCVVNAYTSIQSVQRALVDKLLGESPFEGQNPVDPFCGLEDAQY